MVPGLVVYPFTTVGKAQACNVASAAKNGFPSGNFRTRSLIGVLVATLL